MAFTTLDWVVLVTILSVPIVIGLRFYRRAGADVGQFFLSGRDLPWWLAGTSMVATTFAADTPLAVTGLVSANGVAGNWLWWNAGFGSMLTVFFFARLWRRAGIVTDVEFAELRYAGRTAAVLRGFRALYLGLPINCLIIGWVSLAMSKILSVTLGWDRLTAVLVGLAATGVYSAVSGLRGVVVTDFVLFGFAMAGSIALAYFALSLPEVGVSSRGWWDRRLDRAASAFDVRPPASGRADGFVVNDTRTPGECVRGVSGNPVVGKLVPGSGTGRRWVCCAADDVDP